MTAPEATAAPILEPEGTVSVNGDERLDAAAEAFSEAIAAEESPEGDDSDLAASLDAVAPDEDAEQAEGKADAAPAEEEAAEGEETAAEAEAEDESEKPGAKAYEFAQARRMKRQAERQMDELRQMAADLKAQKEDLEAIPDPRRDSRGNLAAMARRWGMSEAQYIDTITTGQLRDGEPDPMSEVQAVRQELAELKAAREQELQRQQQAQAQAQQQAVIDGAVGEAMRLHDPTIDATVKAQASERWPWLSRAKPEAAQRELQLAASATYRAWQQRGELGHHDQSDLIAEAADMVEGRYAALFGAPPKTTEDRDTSKARDGQGTPDATASKPAGTAPRSLTNKDAASGSTARRTLEGDERLDYAAAAFFE